MPAQPQDHKRKKRRKDEAIGTLSPEQREAFVNMLSEMTIGERSDEAEEGDGDGDDAYRPTAWGFGNAEDLTMPSGQLALVRRPGLQGLMEVGVLRDIDTLTAIVSAEHIARVKRSVSEPLNADEMKKDVAAIQSTVHVVDRVVCHCVLKPTVHMTPNDVTKRDSKKVYADQISIEDKMFIFNYAVGGTRDVERFRQESVAAVGSLVDEPDASDEAERVVRDSGRSDGVVLRPGGDDVRDDGSSGHRQDGPDVKGQDG